MDLNETRRAKVQPFTVLLIGPEVSINWPRGFKSGCTPSPILATIGLGDTCQGMPLIPTVLRLLHFAFYTPFAPSLPVVVSGTPALRDRQQGCAA